MIHRRIADLRRDCGIHETPNGNQALACLAEDMAELIEAGMQADENGPLVNDYVAWIRATPPKGFDYFRALYFLPLWRHPDNPKMRKLARWLFLDPASTWHPLHELKPLSSDVILATPLIGVPAFRELLKRELLDTTVVGKVSGDQDSLSIEAMQSVGGDRPLYAPDVKEVAIRSSPLLARDFYALKISRLEGSPRYEMYWPERRRAAVRKEMARFLDQWGDCFRDRRKCMLSDYGPFDSPPFNLPSLARPATREDIAAGRAIFSLRDRPNAQVRLVPLKPYPTIARWTTFKQFPLREPGVKDWPKEKDANNPDIWKTLPEELFDREGYVWQAEEVFQDGKWRRYYGFVGNHVVARVPAEEIEILDQFSPAHPMQ